MNNVAWIPLGGNIECKKTELKYIPTLLTEGPFAGQYAVSIAKSNIEFKNGSISFDVTLSNQGSRCQLLFNQGMEKNPIVYVGINVHQYAFGICTFKNNAYDLEKMVGSGGPAAIKVGTPMSVRIDVQGSVINLFIDGVSVCKANYIVDKCQLTVWFHGPGEVIVSNFRAELVEPEAFIIMQFSDEFDDLYKEVIAPTCKKYGLKAIRADNIHNCTQILDDIHRSIKEAYLIIADITQDNPNVYYEVGYAHALDKSTILLCEKKRADLPFDISGYRTIFYHDSISGKSAIESSLGNFLKAIMGPSQDESQTK